MAELLDHQDRGVLVDRLVDGGHDAHVHQHLDDFGRLDGHLLRELGDSDGFSDTDFTYHWRSGHLESMPSFRGGLHGTTLRAALFLVAPAHVAGDMQLLTAVARIPLCA